MKTKGSGVVAVPEPDLEKNNWGIAEIWKFWHSGILPIFFCISKKEIAYLQ